MSVQTIPLSAAKYFWGDDISDLDLQNHKKYIIQTLLDKGDRESLRWLFSTFGKREIKQLLPDLKLSKETLLSCESKKSANFWKMYLTD